MRNEEVVRHALAASLEHFEAIADQSNERGVHDGNADHASGRRWRRPTDKLVCENIGQGGARRWVASEAPANEVHRVHALFLGARGLVIREELVQGLNARPRREARFVVALDHLVVRNILGEERAPRA